MSTTVCDFCNEPTQTWARLFLNNNRFAIICKACLPSFIKSALFEGDMQYPTTYGPHEGESPFQFAKINLYNIFEIPAPSKHIEPKDETTTNKEYLLTGKEAVQALVDGQCIESEAGFIYKLFQNDLLMWNSYHSAWTTSHRHLGDILSMSWRIAPSPSQRPLTPVEVAQALHNGGIIRHKKTRTLYHMLEPGQFEKNQGEYWEPSDKPDIWSETWCLVDIAQKDGED